MQSCKLQCKDKNIWSLQYGTNFNIYNQTTDGLWEKNKTNISSTVSKDQYPMLIPSVIISKLSLISVLTFFFFFWLITFRAFFQLELWIYFIGCWVLCMLMSELWSIKVMHRVGKVSEFVSFFFFKKKNYLILRVKIKEEAVYKE